MSLIEGSVYGVHVMALRDNVDGVRTAVRTLADVGPHPYIVSYFSNWTDDCFHYLQMELYHENLWTPPGRERPDCQTVLEHISCVLHYLHDYKKYAHNLVNHWNIYRITDTGSIGMVYKLAGFHKATKLTTTNDDSAVVADTDVLADIRSLCSTVFNLLEEQQQDNYSAADDVEEQELWSYLLCVMDKINLAVKVIEGGSSLLPHMNVSALSIWQWCNARRQTRQRQCPPGLVTSLM